jgi:hypothetical protein
MKCDAKCREAKNQQAVAALDEGAPIVLAIELWGNPCWGGENGHAGPDETIPNTEAMEDLTAASGLTHARHMKRPPCGLFHGGLHVSSCCWIALQAQPAATGSGNSRGEKKRLPPTLMTIYHT